MNDDPLNLVSYCIVIPQRVQMNGVSQSRASIKGCITSISGGRMTFVLCGETIRLVLLEGSHK